MKCNTHQSPVHTYSYLFQNRPHERPRLRMRSPSCAHSCSTHQQQTRRTALMFSESTKRRRRRFARKTKTRIRTLYTHTQTHTHPPLIKYLSAVFARVRSLFTICFLARRRARARVCMSPFTSLLHRDAQKDTHVHPNRGRICV